MSRRKSKFIVYGLLFLAAFFLLFIPSDVVGPFKFVVANVVQIPIKIFSAPLNEIRKIVTYHQTYDQFQFLKREYLVLKNRLSGFGDVQKENSRLARLLDLKRGLVFSSVAANVIGRDPDSWNSVIIIDRGREDGIDVGMPVLSSLGVVGKIAEAGAKKSKVILLTDPSFSVTAVVKRSREVGLVSGTLSGMSQMKYLSANADVKVGDIVETSKLSSAFPEGLLIGEVIDVRKDENSLTKRCIIRPTVALSQLEEVLVVENNS